MARQITAAQQRCLEVVARYIQRNGVAPTIMEIADALGISSKAAWDHISALQQKGAVQKQFGRRRGIVVVP